MIFLLCGIFVFNCPLAKAKETKTSGASAPLIMAKITNLPPEEEDWEIEEEVVVSDPLEGFNRVMFQFNDRFYFYLLKPLAQGYGYIVPEPGREAIKRFFLNLLTPIRLANCILQLKFAEGGIEIGRFMINSTFGIGGLFDPAREKAGLTRYKEDFGQTMGHYGVGGGFYIVWPIIGPSTLRDSIGLPVDNLITPYYWLGFFEGLAVDSGRVFNDTSLAIGQYEDIKKEALDPYLFIRNAYIQHRNGEIKK